MRKETALVELYGLIDFYYENRDMPVPDDFDFFDKIKECCEVLEVNNEEIIKEFKLQKI
ncbi:hypothetical protein AALF85_08815 [Jeotgalicoccus halotolerans]|uniref:hypothetical protein n=1 Tax=Jeotgalicoccus halotolerans TaxID=157227 RepID=UPI0035129D1B